MALIYTHTLPGGHIGIDALLKRQSCVAAFGRVVAVVTQSGVDFYDANSITELSSVLDAGVFRWSRQLVYYLLLRSDSI